MSLRYRPHHVEPKSRSARVVVVLIYHHAQSTKKRRPRRCSTRPHRYARASKGWPQAASLVRTDGSVASSSMSDLVFKHLSLTPSNVDSRHGACWSDSKTTSSAALYRLAEVVFDPLSTSVARLVSGNACGPRAMDGRVGRSRSFTGVGKGLKDKAVGL